MASDSLFWGERLEAWRKAKGLTRVQLAHRLEVDPGAIYRWEKRGDPVLSDRQAELLLEVTGIEPERARRGPAGPSVGRRLAALEAKVVNLEERLAAVEGTSPPRKRPSASTSPAAGTTDADLNAAAAAAREERPRRRK